MSCNGYKHPKNCKCGMGGKRKTKPPYGKEQPDVKTSQVKPAQAEAPAASSRGLELPQGAESKISADKLPVQPDTIKTIGSPDSPVKQAREQSQLDNLMAQLNTGSVNPPAVPVDKTVPVNQPGSQAGQSVKPADTKPPEPTPPVAVPGAAVVDLKGILEAQAGTVLKAPFDISNAILSTDKFKIPSDKEAALIKQFVHLSNLFGWDKLLTEAKWIALMVFFISYGGTWMGCLGEARKEKQKPKEESSKDVQADKKPDGPVKPVEFKAERLV